MKHDRWYMYNLEEAIIVECLSDKLYNDFEIRRYKKDGSIERKTVKWVEGMRFINENHLKYLDEIE